MKDKTSAISAHKRFQLRSDVHRMSNVDSLNLDRRPYVVEYYKDGKKVKINRRPPPLMHTALPEDKVILTNQKNADYRNGDRFTVMKLNPRHPNILQLQDKDGNKTFVPYMDIEIVERAIRNGGGRSQNDLDNRYLDWP